MYTTIKTDRKHVFSLFEDTVHLSFFQSRTCSFNLSSKNNKLLLSDRKIFQASIHGSPCLLEQRFLKFTIKRDISLQKNVLRFSVSALIAMLQMKLWEGRKIVNNFKAFMKMSSAFSEELRHATNLCLVLSIVWCKCLGSLH